MESISNIFTSPFLPSRDPLEGYTPLLRKIIDNLPAGVIVLDAKGFILDHNPVAREMLEEDLNGKKWTYVITHHVISSDVKLDTLVLKNTKKIRLATQSLYPIAGQLILMHDMTETCKLQDESMHQQRLLYLGRMAANIAHQIRTPLATAILYVKNLLDAKQNQQIINAELNTKFLNKIFKSLSHIESQIKGMLLFAKGSQIVKSKISLEKFISIIQASNESIPLNLTCTDELKRQNITCNSDLLLGCLQGCINNAMEASKDKPLIKMNFYNNKKDLYISITDHAGGISPELMTKIFEPFFTTKESGTGLGLSIAKLVANAHDGDLEIKSNPGLGTSVTFRLPIVEWGMA